MNKPPDQVLLLLFSLLIIWTTSRLIHDASLAFPKTSHGLLSHFKLPYLVFVHGVPQFALGPCKSKGQIIIDYKCTIPDNEGCLGLLQPCPLHTPPYPWLIIRSISHFFWLCCAISLPCVTSLPLNHCRSDGHLNIDDDMGYSKPLQHAAPYITLYLWPIIRFINRIGVDSTLFVCFGARVFMLDRELLIRMYYWGCTGGCAIGLEIELRCQLFWVYLRRVTSFMWSARIAPNVILKRFISASSLVPFNTLMSILTQVLHTLLERTQTSDINIHRPNIKISIA
ncbi:LOW QUALITY PROTEIN: hypothetical protein Cgig2_003230 [Carnegiea gigantea]|uniref:Uncharacterized protein n=1 Tax=Carnegiea gigantea TaxID=171969 RepID=A0A9Q1JTQ5_9CARY|nr:LOW QUALITY PROTEIN: hypothetical protein Cgig2_003230 [Carnegiea gigantea]